MPVHGRKALLIHSSLAGLPCIALHHSGLLERLIEQTNHRQRLMDQKLILLRYIERLVRSMAVGQRD
jgi:hypothetical protein